jgi:hypothetical protein
MTCQGKDRYDDGSPAKYSFSYCSTSASSSIQLSWNNLPLIILCGHKEKVLEKNNFSSRCFFPLAVSTPPRTYLSHGHFWLLMERVVTQINSLSIGFGFIGAPRLTPQPFLRQGKDWNLVLNIVRQVLIEVGETAWVR